mgnify:CR=1 FL=1
MLTIRKTKKRDIGELSKIYKRVYDRPKDGGDWSIKRAKDLLNFYFTLKTFIGLTAVIDGKIVGALFSFVKPWHDGNRLGEGELFVDPEYQNQRIGTKLFLKINEIGEKKGCKIHEMLVYGRVERWYKKLGVKESGLKHMEGNIKEIIRRINLYGK